MAPFRHGFPTRALPRQHPDRDSSFDWHGRRDSNPQRLVLETSALVHLSYAHSKPSRGQPWEGLRVSDGDRTRGLRDHNATLYQLSYTHQDTTRRRAASRLAVVLRARPRSRTGTPLRYPDLSRARLPVPPGGQCARSRSRTCAQPIRSRSALSSELCEPALPVKDSNLALVVQGHLSCRMDERGMERREEESNPCRATRPTVFKTAAQTSQASLSRCVVRAPARSRTWLCGFGGRRRHPMDHRRAWSLCPGSNRGPPLTRRSAQPASTEARSLRRDSNSRPSRYERGALTD